MSNIAIKAENLSKAYQLGEIGTGTISRDLERWFARIRGKEDPYLRIGESNDRTSKGTSDIVWSLKDINFEIEQGDAVGIIGRNGAGKSTLLKILSKVTSPTTGKIAGKGRIASLLEVGTGFHPELTGRENIFLNGAILGMRKAEIKKHFDAIVDFAGIERYIDTPVKRYSSGMYVRLAFAVAAHLESEILIVDEVLAVGDAEFQKKCLGKMGEVSKGEGRTVLFVSHNMGAVKNLCDKGIYLDRGNIITVSDIQSCIQTYLNSFDKVSDKYTNHDIKGTLTITEAYLKRRAISGEDLQITLIIQSKIIVDDVFISILIKDDDDQLITTFYTKHMQTSKVSIKEGRNAICCTAMNNPLVRGTYNCDFWLSVDGVQTSEFIENALTITVQEDLFFDSGFQSSKGIHGVVNQKNYWLNDQI
jgi:lipopolysaccharide transport system ATP-binding protein